MLRMSGTGGIPGSTSTADGGSAGEPAVAGAPTAEAGIGAWLADDESPCWEHAVVINGMAKRNAVRVFLVNTSATLTSRNRANAAQTFPVRAFTGKCRVPQRDTVAGAPRTGGYLIGRPVTGVSFEPPLK